MSSLVSLMDEYIAKGQILSPLQDYDRSKEAILFREVVNKISGSKNIIEGFDNWVENILPEQVMNKNFISDDGVKITFSDVFLHKPMRVIDNKEMPLYPQYCRDYHFPYSGKLEATCTAERGKDKRVIKINLGQVPIMLGSKKCNLYGKTPEELVELGECITDPFGYFIVSSEWALVTHDKMRRNIPMVLLIKKNNSKPYIKNVYTVNKILILKLGKDWNNIELIDPAGGKDDYEKNFPVFFVYNILAGIKPDEAIEKYILPLVPKIYHRQVKNMLNSSAFEFNNIQDPLLYIYNLRYDYKKNEDKAGFRESLKEDIINAIFCNIKDENEQIKIDKKLTAFSYMLVKFILYTLDIVPLDQKDSWSNKRFDTAAIHMEGLFSLIFDSVLMTCRKKSNKMDKQDYMNFGDYLNSKSKDIFKKNFEHSFNTNNWEVKSMGYSKKNYRETLKRTTPLALYAQMVKNTNTADTSGACVEVREIQPSQRNRHCIMETPEGQNIGIVKYNAITGIFSLQRDPKSIEIMTKEYECQTRNILVLINGFPIDDGEKIIFVDTEFRNHAINFKRYGKIPYDTEIVYNKNLNTIEIFCDSSRPICPFLVVNQKTRELVIEEKKAWDLSYEELIKNGCIEFLSAREEEDENIIVSKSITHFYETGRLINTSDDKYEYYKKIYNYSHCCIDPLQMFSLTTSTSPMANHQMAPRTNIQSGMAKQALGYYNINYHLRYEKEMKQLYKSERSITETDVYFLPKMDLFPSGQIANVAFYCEADNQEDAIVISEDFVNSGKLNYVKYKVFSSIITTNTKGCSIKLKKPPLKLNEDPNIYRHLEENGLPKLDSYIKPGDCILGKVKITDKGEENQSSYAEMDTDGYVDRVLITRDKVSQNPIVRIKLRLHRKYVAGDKLALRYAQKGTIGRVAKREEMPKVSSGPNKGIRPDVVFNPHGFPSRQTAGLLIEGLITKAAIYDGKRVDVSSFRKQNIEQAMEVLKENGLDPYGYEEMELDDGRKLDTPVFFVPVFEQVLKHHVKDKFHYRNTGSRDFLTHQPKKGRALGGGLRVGEMEKDVFGAHGASEVIRERMMYSSDEFKVVVCSNCGNIINNKICTVCDKSSPCLVTLPYVFKVLIRLLNAVGIDVRINTKIQNFHS